MEASSWDADETAVLKRLYLDLTCLKSSYSTIVHADTHPHVFGLRIRDYCKSNFPKSLLSLFYLYSFGVLKVRRE